MTTRGRVRTERTAKRVRAFLGGRPVADSDNVLMVWEKPYYPTYYFPAGDVRTDALAPTGETHRSPSRGEAELHTVKVEGAEAPAAAAWFRESPLEEITDHIRFDWEAMDAWFEEDEQVYVHPRDPYSRIDILQSSRNVRIEIDGVTVADSDKPRILFETGLPARYYLPKTDVRLELLEPTDLHTDCPYKGTASYYNVVIDGTVHENVVWWYPAPVAESAAIAGYVCFYNEKVDVFVDGVAEDRPKTQFG